MGYGVEGLQHVRHTLHPLITMPGLLPHLAQTGIHGTVIWPAGSRVWDTSLFHLKSHLVLSQLPDFAQAVPCALPLCLPSLSHRVRVEGKDISTERTCEHALPT